jgi:hypothetical protein
LTPAHIAEITNIADPALRLNMMRDTVSAVQAHGNLFYPQLNLVSTFIDGLVSAPRGKNKVQYIAYLENHFPELSDTLGAEVFYEHYRCVAVHEFGLGDGYAIGRNSGMNRNYVETQTVQETGQVITVLNIDRFVADFFFHIDLLLAQQTN